MVVVSSDNQFPTSNTALAAWLISQGFGTPDIEFNGSKAYFIFIRQDPQMKHDIDLWDSLKAEGNCSLFFNAYQTLLRRIQERY